MKLNKAIQPLKLLPENAWNPLHRGEYRNKKCPCFSGLKVKSCHGKKEYVEKCELDKHNEFVKFLRIKHD